MITNNERQSEGLQRNTKNNDQFNKNNNSRQQNRWNNGRQQQGNNPQSQNSNPDRNQQATSCALCNLVKKSGVQQPYMNRYFTDIHEKVTDKQPFPNRCLSWMILSLDDRIKILQKSKLYCQVCLRLLSTEAAASGRSCSNDKHTQNSGCNGLCIEQKCSYDATICKQHERENRESHRLLKEANLWRDQKLKDLDNNEQISCLTISLPEEGSDKVNHMESYREDTHMSPMPSL